jgi:hypothetical protein
VLGVLDGEKLEDELIDEGEDGGVGAYYTSASIPFKLNTRVA